MLLLKTKMRVALTASTALKWVRSILTMRISSKLRVDYLKLIENSQVSGFLEFSWDFQGKLE